jgi:hypothetical protein
MREINASLIEVDHIFRVEKLSSEIFSAGPKIPPH